MINNSSKVGKHQSFCKQ